MKEWSSNSLSNSALFPLLWCFAFDCKVWRIITATVQAPSQAPQLRITILLSVHFSSVPPPKSRPVIRQIRATSNTHLITKVHRASVGLWPCLCLFSQTHIYTQLFSWALKVLSLPGSTDSFGRKPDEVTVGSHSLWSPLPISLFFLFFISPFFPLSYAWSASPLTWSWFIKQHLLVIPATEEYSGPLQNIIAISHAKKYTLLCFFPLLLCVVCLYWKPAIWIDEALRKSCQHVFVL